MWRPWGKSTARIHSSSSSSLPSSPFSCSSFKDIQTLCLDEPPHQSLPSSPTPKYPIFQRVLLANSLLRTWSTHLHQHHHHRLPRTRSHPEPESEPKPSPDQEPSPPQNENEAHAPPVLYPPPSLPPPIYFPGTEQRVVIYFTSLRVVRPIFEDCKSALAILRAFRVHLDERDVSMDSSFLTELNRVMGRTGRPVLSLPRVFIGGKYVGGGEEIRSMHEIGELKKLMEDLPVVEPTECHVCAGHRFVLCNVCNGSKKVFTDKAGFKICVVCNENGLLRCPSCFSFDLINNEKIE
ncbi:uncharacterized protein At5g39865-like [Vicia villosa]|uniref:uncharacterized protein At5g39865-like n=1 Tax=Vicia villosa TaxID=3911 RepID=UPI00273C4D27|nr:uncharacterized protein At5g39865-like [Vicia villosa]